GKGDAREMVGVSLLGAATRTRIALADRRRMGHFSQKIIAILVSAGMLVQMKFVTWGERATVAGTGDQVVGSFFFFHAKFGDGVAFGFINVDAGIVVNFILGVAADLGDGLHI